jgi:hypothetical protein
LKFTLGPAQLGAFDDDASLQKLVDAELALNLQSLSWVVDNIALDEVRPKIKQLESQQG